MTAFLVDSDWIIDALHELSNATETLSRLSSAGVAASIICYGEVYEGAFFARTPDQALEGIQDFFSGVTILPLIIPIMERFAIVRGGLSRQVRRQIGDMDLLVAATALEHDLTLVTRNIRDFRHVPDLRLYLQSETTSVG